MRFTKDGPWVPDQLLNARDAGNVVFFCGAGVSMAKANLPNFFSLAERVIRDLGVSESSDALKVLDKAKEIGNELALSGLISADRVFGLLEREFTVEDIQASVARSLKPEAEPDLSAHKVLLRLATTTESKTQLVTTNFDRLFEQCNSNLSSFQPPRLPNPSRYDDLDGVVYLHGRVDEGYAKPEGHGFVLSSADFGHSYLSEGWATEFFREIVRKYVVVFVGYSADDPPINYLLEGLRRTENSSRYIYAFQSEDSDEAIARWHHKGVEAICYESADEHAALWESLELWARRADDPASWQKSLLDLAIKGPRTLQPFQRGQVAHVVSTYNGAREFADSKASADWLCVFDPSFRYARPGRLDWLDVESHVVTPFEWYGLDSDASPEGATSEDAYSRREVPADAWDAFVANTIDRYELSNENWAVLRGQVAGNNPRLPRRIECLSTWLMNVAHQPAAVWWAAHQRTLHSDVQKGIRWRLSRKHENFSPIVRMAWQYLFEAWEDNNGESQRDWYDLKDEIENDGWSPLIVRKIVSLSRPFLQAGASRSIRPIPPEKDAELHLWDLAKIEVNCPVLPGDFNIPENWLAHVIRGLRKNMEVAVSLSDEVDDKHRFRICPIIEDDSPDISKFERARGLSGCVMRFASLFEQLVGFDSSLASKELVAWPQDDDTAFSRLRIWAGGIAEITKPEAFGIVVEELSDDAFWRGDHQRDLMLILARRWSDLPDDSRKRIENRLLEGPSQRKNEEKSNYEEYRARATMGRLQWLAKNNCEFSFTLEKELAARRPQAPQWKDQYADHVADSREMRGGYVAMNTEHTSLIRGPIDSILPIARELAGRTEGNRLEELDPYAGLCAEHPRRAYLALIHAARQQEYPEWAWKKFLNSSAREKDEPMFIGIVAERLCRFPQETRSKLLYSTTYWLQNVAEPLSAYSAKSFDKLTSKLINAMRSEPPESKSIVLSSKDDRDWVTDALNSPAGHISRAILEDSRIDSTNDQPRLSVDLRTRLENLLSLPGDPRRHAIAIIAHHLGWLHLHIPEWTEQHLLSILSSKSVDDQRALWSGFLWNPRITSDKLYLKLKPSLLALAKRKDASRTGHIQALAYLILSGWIAIEKAQENRQVSSAELRDTLLQGGDDFRSHVIWQIERVFRDNDETDLGALPDRSVELFEKVWPQQKTVKTPTMSLRLMELLFSSEKAFSTLAEPVLPLLTRLDSAHSLYFRDEIEKIIGTNSSLLLGVLLVGLPEDVSEWPYEIGEILDKIGEADDSDLGKQFQELRRKWTAR